MSKHFICKCKTCTFLSKCGYIFFFNLYLIFVFFFCIYILSLGVFVGGWSNVGRTPQKCHFYFHALRFDNLIERKLLPMRFPFFFLPEQWKMSWGWVVANYPVVGSGYIHSRSVWLNEYGILVLGCVWWL